MMTTQAITQPEDELGSMDSEDIAHLAGFFDAAGSLTVRVAKDKNYRLNYSFTPLLRLLRPDENDPVLGKLAAYCEERGIRYSMTEQSRGAGREDVSIKFTITEVDSIGRFLAPMMEHLLSKYLASELMLDKILPAFEDDKHHSKGGILELMGMADELRNLKTNPQEVKYTQEYFENEWSDSE